MYRSRPAICLCVALVLLLVSLGAASTASALANRVFVSARSGNDANACDNIATPCQTFAGAVIQLNPGGEAIVLDSGGYGAVTVTKALTIEAPAGVTAFIHPSSGDAVTINAGVSDTVILRGLVLNGGSGNGIAVNTVGRLSVEDCVVSGFTGSGIHVVSAGVLNVKNTAVTGCGIGVAVLNTTGAVRAAIDHCHLDGNAEGFRAATTSPGTSTTVATNSTANENVYGWRCGAGGSGADVLNLESCSGSENLTGVLATSLNASSAVRYSNSVFSNNGDFGISQANACVAASRGNNTITGNASGPTNGVIGSFSPL